MIRWMKCRRDARLTKNKHYFFISAMNSSTQPKTKRAPPIGVMIRMAVGTALFMAFSEATMYREPENKTMPPIKRNPA